MNLSARAQSWRREHRRAILLEAAARLACGTLAAGGLAALLDKAAGLPQSVRSGAFAVWACWSLWEVYRRLWSAWRALGWREVFSSAAERWPESRPLLFSAWGLRDGAGGPGISEELRAEHLARADRLAGELPEQPVAAWSPSPVARRLAAAAGVILTLNAVAGDRASWRRVAAPWGDAALERFVSVAPKDARLDWGGPATVSARIVPGSPQRGLRASDLVLETRGIGGAWRATDWSRTSVEEALWSISELSAPVEYRLRWRDLVSRAYRLEPVAPPRWRRAEAVVRGSRGSRRFVLGADAAVLARRGDWVSLEAEPDVQLRSTNLLISGKPPIAMRREGEAWKTGFVAAEDATFSFELEAADGRRDPSAPSYSLSVAADSSPTAELLSPQVPLVASPDDSIPVIYAARDDGAVTRADLVVQVQGRPLRRMALPVPAPPRDEVLGDSSWPLEGLRAGERAEFWIEAFDDASPPQTGRSEKGSVELLDSAAEHRAALAARQTAQEALERAASRADSARDASARGDLDASRSETESLAAEWTATSRALSQWEVKAAVDPRGEPGLADEASRAAREFARAGAEGLPAARKALLAGDLEKAGREQSALAEQAHGVQRAVQEGAQAQTLLDMAASAEDARHTSEELSGQAERLASRGKDGTVSPAELAALEEQLARVDEALESLRRAVSALPQPQPGEDAPQSRELPLDAARSAAGELRRALASGDVARAARAARRLAEQLSSLAKTLEEAGRRSAEERGRRGRQAADAVARSWQEAVEAQSRAVEAAGSLEEDHDKSLLAAQRALLADLAQRQEVLLSSSSSRPGLWPQGARQAAMEVVRQFREGPVTDASARLGSIATLLRLTAASHPSDAAALASFAAAEEDLRDRLSAGAAVAPPVPERSRGAALAQARARRRAEALREEIVQSSRRLGLLTGRLVRRVDSALSEQAQAEKAFQGGDWPQGLRRAEAALAILQEGGEQAQSAASAARREGSGEPGAGGRFVQGSVRAAPRGAAGTSLGRVRLPSAEEYRPPKDLREELEKSLREPRPAAHDSDIKEYFKRLVR